MKFTKSVHTGGYSQINQSHNNRTKTNRMEHVDPDGKIVILQHQALSDAYDEVFGDALKKYNDSQKRESRKIKSYYNKILKEYKSGIKEKQSNVRQPGYETIIQIGNRDLAPTDAKSEAILTDFYKWFKELPNIHTFGAYLHFDEEGAPHLHLDYFFHSDGYKRGLSRQNGMEKALNSMGFFSQGKKQTAQEEFTRYCKQKLTEIAKSHGIDLAEDKKCSREHLHTEDYKLQQSVESKINNLLFLENENLKLQHQNEKLHKTIQKGKIAIPKEEYEQLMSDLSDRKNEFYKMRQAFWDEQVKNQILTEENERLDAVAEAALHRENRANYRFYELQQENQKIKEELIKHRPDLFKSPPKNIDRGISR